MSKHIGTVSLRLFIAVLATVIVSLSPVVLPAAECAQRLPAAAGSVRNGPCPAPAAAGARASKLYGRLPLYFMANRGQVNDKVLFYEKGPGHATFFTRKSIVMSLRGADGKINRTGHEAARARALPGKSPAGSAAGVRSSFLEVRMLGMNKDVRIAPAEAQSGKVNYFIGNDPGKWRMNIPTYGAVLYKNAYPGIDVKFYGNNRQLEYDIIVKPGADPSRVRFRYSGAKDVHVTAGGDLAIELAGGRLAFKKPLIYQELDGRRVLRQGKFAVRRDKREMTVLNASDKTGPAGAKLGAFTCRFDIGAYDRKSPLVIDPVLIYSTYFGGSADNEADALAVDSSGNIYVTGITTSTDFPVKNGAQAAYAGGTTFGDVFVTKIAAGGASLVYSTYLGGTGNDWGSHIAVDGAGNAYVTGGTYSIDFPLQKALNSSLAGGEDAFVAEIAAGGQSLVYSTYLGGSDDDEAWGIAVDSSGNAYVAGLTLSSDFPTKNAFQANPGGGANTEDAFVAEIAAGGQSLVYSTYLGGTGDDAAYGIALDSTGNAYVTGLTLSSDFPTKNAIQPKFAGGTMYGDAFVTEVAVGGASLVYSTYLGGSRDDWADAIAVDGAGNAYVAGVTLSTDFPVKNAVQSANGGGYDAFVTKIAAGGASLVYSTYLGGSGDDAAYGIAVDGSGNAYLAGWTDSTAFPTVNALRPAFAGGDYDAFIAEIENTLWNSTDLGGGWMWLDWFGYFNAGNYPWVYHSTLGWLYPFGSTTSSIWVWDAAMGAFWWTSATVYPFLYRASDGAWLFYDVASSKPRYFFNYSTQSWEKH